MKVKMKINFKTRLQNKVTLIALCMIILTVVYQVLGWFGITPGVSQDAVQNVIELCVKALILLGVVVDPNTKGIQDSDRAMTYEKPADDQGVA
jgi:phi LC3 family holin